MFCTYWCRIIETGQTTRPPKIIIDITSEEIRGHTSLSTALVIAQLIFQFMLCSFMYALLTVHLNSLDNICCTFGKLFFFYNIVTVTGSFNIVRRQKPIFGLKCAISGNNHLFAFFDSSWYVDKILPGWELAIGLAFSESKMAARMGDTYNIM